MEPREHGVEKCIAKCIAMMVFSRGGHNGLVGPSPNRTYALVPLIRDPESPQRTVYAVIRTRTCFDWCSQDPFPLGTSTGAWRSEHDMPTGAAAVRTEPASCMLPFSPAKYRPTFDRISAALKPVVACQNRILHIYFLEISRNRRVSQRMPSGTFSLSSYLLRSIRDTGLVHHHSVPEYLRVGRRPRYSYGPSTLQY